MKHIRPLLVIDNQITHQEETDFWSPKWKVCPSVCPVKFVCIYVYSCDSLPCRHVYKMCFYLTRPSLNICSFNIAVFSTKYDHNLL